MYYKENTECLEFPWDHRMRLDLEQLAANQESEQQMEHNEDLEPEDYEKSINNPDTRENNITQSQFND